jgi:hypothetical protein
MWNPPAIGLAISKRQLLVPRSSAAQNPSPRRPLRRGPTRFRWPPWRRGSDAVDKATCPPISILANAAAGTFAYILAQTHVSHIREDLFLRILGVQTCNTI